MARSVPQRSAAVLLAVVAALSAAGCKKGAASLCTADVKCAPGFSCDANTGRCACANDASCAADETCNAAGFCQPKLRCASTADCAVDSICDSKTGSCIPAETCTTDVQCKQGQVCQPDFTCTNGCRATGDCPIGMVCRDCAPGTAAADCPVGKQCVLGPCDSQLSCPYGDYCVPDTTGEKVCTPDSQHRPFCEPCARTAGSPYYCANSPANYCLIDTSKPLGQASYCGVDCSAGQACPNGYQCRDVRIVTAQNCKPEQGLSACTFLSRSTPAVTCDPAKNHARTDGLAGTVNDDCEAAQPPLVGAVCDPQTRKCSAQCTGTGEAGVQAFCSCIEDSDCPTDQCDSSTRACTVSGRPCIVGRVPDDCQSTNRIFCVKATDPRLGPVGYCRIGQNCAPAEGFTCATLRSP